MTFKNTWQESEIRAVLFTDQESIPLFFSALSVKFPGRVRFGVVNQDSDNGSVQDWTQTILPGKNLSLPVYLLVTNEGAYVYGRNQGDCLTFNSMETLLKFLHPCLNDIFIFSFLMANLVSVLELFIAQGGLGRRLRRCLWCVVKFNAAVIMLWLPLIALFQLPYLDNLPLVGLKASRLLATSSFGEALRKDYFFFSQHPYLLSVTFLSACTIFGILAYKLTGGRYDEDNEPWFNFAQMRTLTHLRSNEFFEPMFMSGYELSGGMEIFGSRLYLPTMSLQPVVSPHYIHLLPTWPYCSKIKSSHDCCNSTSCHNEECSKENAPASLTCQGTMEFGQGSFGQMTSSLERESAGGHIFPCTASANDLLDGNYHCECQQHARLDQLSESASSGQSQSVSGQAASVESVSCEHSYSFLTSDDSRRCTSCQLSTESKPSTPAPSDGSPEADQSEREVEASLGSAPEQQSSAVEWVDFPDGYLACSQCVICLEDYVTGVMLCGLPCSHVFHHSCILTWLKRDHHFCPVCRWPSFRPRPQLLHAHAEWRSYGGQSGAKKEKTYCRVVLLWWIPRSMCRTFRDAWDFFFCGYCQYQKSTVCLLGLLHTTTTKAEIL